MRKISYKAKISNKPLTAYFGGQTAKLSPTNEPLLDCSTVARLYIQPRGAYDMILSKAREYGKAFTYDDLLIEIKADKTYDWFAKDSTFERYIRALCKAGLLFKLSKGVYIYNKGAIE